MKLQQRSRSHQQVVRLLQICLVVEEMVETRARDQAAGSTEVDRDVQSFLEETADTSARHRERLELLVERLEADPDPCDDVQQLVDDQYRSEKQVGDLLYDHLCDAETAFRLYDNLLKTISGLDAVSAPERRYLRSVLTELRAEERQRVRRITERMDTVA